MKMHIDQVDVPIEVVAQLVVDQFPEWRDLHLRAITSHGTVNALYRLGDDLVLRLPLQPGPGLRDDLVAEMDHVRSIAPHLPLPVPVPVAIGGPGAGYPGAWTAYRWIPGVNASLHTMGDPARFAEDLAGFVTALHGIDPGGRTWDGRTRGGPLRDYDETVCRALAESAHLTDRTGLQRVWDQSLAAPAFRGPDVWIHADLMPGNLIVRDGRLVAVIDFGTVGVGDPAVDLLPAWTLLPPRARGTYRGALGVDGATWERGRGWALVQAIMALPYYVDTNPVMAATARHALSALLEPDGRQRGR